MKIIFKNANKGMFLFQNFNSASRNWDHSRYWSKSWGLHLIQGYIFFGSNDVISRSNSWASNTQWSNGNRIRWDLWISVQKAPVGLEMESIPKAGEVTFVAIIAEHKIVEPNLLATLGAEIVHSLVVIESPWKLTSLLTKNQSVGNIIDTSPMWEYQDLVYLSTPEKDLLQKAWIGKLQSSWVPNINENHQ